MKRSLAALFLTAAMGVPALAAPSMVLRGIASGSHPFALMEVDHSTYLLGVGDTIDGKTIRSIGINGVKLTDGTTLHVTGGDDAPVAGTTVVRNSSHARRVASDQEDFYENDTDVEGPPIGYGNYAGYGGYGNGAGRDWGNGFGNSAAGGSGYGYGYAPFYGGYGYAYPGLGFSGYPYDGYGYGYGYGSRNRYRPNNGSYGSGYNGGAYGFGAGFGAPFAPGRYNVPGSGAPGSYNTPGLTTFGHARGR